MKLSDAIKLGSMLQPQGFGLMFKGGGSCAMGAALEAVGRNKSLFHFCECLTIWPEMTHSIVECPQCEVSQTHAISLAIHLNDKHRWTRERIADFVATLEAAEVAVPVQVLAEAEAVPVGAAR